MFARRRNLRRGGVLIAHRFGRSPARDHGTNAVSHALHSFARSGMESNMHNALMLGLAASILLGMWAIWKVTP